MSKNNNVNPGQYKVAGRERQGEDIDPQQEKAALKQSAQQPGKGSRKRTKPGTSVRLAGETRPR